MFLATLNAINIPNSFAISNCDVATAHLDVLNTFGAKIYNSLITNHFHSLQSILTHLSFNSQAHYLILQLEIHSKPRNALTIYQ
jgi:hypothetical protein